MNKSGKIIILYDNNERIASQAATVFVQRGVDNVFLLSGGKLVRLQGQPMVTHLPVHCLFLYKCIIIIIICLTAYIIQV